MTDISAPESCGKGVSTSLSLHASIQSECLNHQNLVTIDELRNYINSLLNVSTIEECNNNIAILENYYLSLDKEINLKKANAVAFNLFKLANLKSDLILQKFLNNPPPGYNTADNSGSDSDNSSTEFSNTEKSKKRTKKSSPTAEKSVSKKSKKAEEVPFVSNPYQPIAPEDYEPDMELSNEEEQYPEFPNLTSVMPPSASEQPLSTDPIQSQQPPQPKKKYVPPIIIDDPSNTAQLIKSFNELTDSKVEGKLLSNNRLKVFPTSAEAHRTIQKEITKKNLKSHTFEMEDERQLKVVIRGLHEDYAPEDIIEYLQSLKFKPIQCHLLRHRQTKTNNPLYLVTLPKTNDSKAIFHLQNIGYMRVTFEPLKRKTTPAQFYRCQEFFHHSRFCQRDPRCLKCAEKHLTKDCTKPSDTPAKCCLCNGSHTANFTGCPQNPLNKKKEQNPPEPKRTFNPPPANAWTNPAALPAIKTPRQIPPTQSSTTSPLTTSTFQDHNQTQATNSSPNNSQIFSQISQLMNTFLVQLAVVLQTPYANRNIQQ
ncbi:Nucleic-acid-binding protein from transposon X-element [Araneus ventricosus]|uniref:Nucleic-acid-binding protein from transposon X-element n=1 Tax=Araneus ventricosus TaxID=182803 RepID=A0A4Y2U2H2_ARAVE|nr:Nucleic-acid-binding protein from transposon X-element [Araneus ventricosus]